MRRPRPELGCSGTERIPHIVSEQMVSRPIFEIVTSRIEARKVTSKGKGKGKFTLKQATMAQRESRGVTLLFL